MRICSRVVSAKEEHGEPEEVEGLQPLGEAAKLVE